MGIDDKEYYNAREAMDKLGMKKGLFYYYVNERNIEKHLPPHRKRGAYFLAKDIEDLAASLHIFVKQYTEDKKSTIFRMARPEDAQGMNELGEQIMQRSGGYGIPAESLLPFLSIPNSEIGHVLVRDKKVIGYFTLLPLRHDKLLEMMSRKMRVREVQAKDLIPFGPGEPIDCFIWEVISDPTHKHIGQYLIGKMLTFFHTLGKRGVKINGIYAIALSPEGINLCRRMGMQLMDLPDIIQPNFMPFEWKIQETKNWFTRNYIQALKSYDNRLRRLKTETDET
ncbi:MAG: hypothetical protein ACRDFB_05510 [Rhabdochlamydiaceae bacterium]